MPSASVSIDWGILSHVGIEAASERRDGLALESGLLRAQEATKGKGNPKWASGGRKVVEVQMYAPTGATSFSTGYEGYDPTQVETSRDAIFSPAISGILLKIGSREIRMYGSSTKGLKSKVQSLVTSGMGFMHRNWTQRVVAGLGSGFGDWITFNGFDVTGASGGIFERSAVGSQSNTIGGLSKSTYSFAIGWQNRVVNLNNAYGSNQNGLYQLVTATKRHKTGGTKYWLFSDQGMNNQKRAVQANERYYTKDALDSGRPVEIYHNFPIYQEPQMPVSTATGGSTTNTYPITAALVDADDIFFEWMPAVKMDGASLPDGYFGVGDWRPISGMQDVWGMPMNAAGQTIVTDMGSSGVAYAGETY